MPLRRATRTVTLATGLALGLSGVSAAPAAAAPDHEMPFGCSQQWTGTTRAAHRPNAQAIDFNRPADLGALTVASAPGVVAKVGDAGNRSYGKWIQVDHGGGYSTVFAHLMAQWVVPGQRVDQGTVLGRVGNTGGVSGPHLHFEQRLGSTVRKPWFHQVPFAFGRAAASLNCPDVPVAGDWNADGTDDVGVFRREVGTFETRSTDGSVTSVRFGLGSDQPIVGDWDGDGVTDVGVRRQLSRKFFLRLRDGSMRTVQAFGITDVAVTGDWDGDGVTDLGIWRPRVARFRLRLPGGTDRLVALGSTGSQPVTGDWNADGVTDVGVFDAATATFTLRASAADGTTADSVVAFGTSSDLPVTGDWNGDGATDVGTWTPATATYSLRTSPPPGGVRARVRSLPFGRPR